MSSNLETSLFKKAELLKELRNYEVEDVHNCENSIDITASQPNSEDTVLMRILPDSKTGLNRIGVKEVQRIKEELEEEDHEKVIIFANRITTSAKKELREEDIEFFTKKKKMLSTLQPQQVYPTLLESIDKLCQIKCGHIPQSEEDCKGYTKEGHYTCKVRLISDNADFHSKRGWRSLLSKDLDTLLKMLLEEKSDESLIVKNQPKADSTST